MTTPADEVSAAFTIKADATKDGVGYFAAEAGTGYRYNVTTSQLPNAGVVGEGGPVLVTVTSPFTDAWALQGTGYLDEEYIRDHLCGGSLHEASDADIRALTLLIRHALGRHSENS